MWGSRVCVWLQGAHVTLARALTHRARYSRTPVLAYSRPCSRVLLRPLSFLSNPYTVPGVSICPAVRGALGGCIPFPPTPLSSCRCCPLRCRPPCLEGATGELSSLSPNPLPGFAYTALPPTADERLFFFEGDEGILYPHLRFSAPSRVSPFIYPALAG